MYIAQILKDRIKAMCKYQNVSMEQMLSACNLGVNAIRQISDSKGMSSFSLARIADYLNCSVDYLLGRTDKQNSSPANAEELSNDEIELIQNYRNLNDEGQEKVRDYVTDIVLSGRYKKDNEAGMVQEA